MTELIFERENRLGLIGLNRVSALNALNLSMIQALNQQLKAWQEDESIAAVLIYALPGKAFCAGGDVRWIYSVGLKKDPLQMEFFAKEYALNLLIAQYKKPYLAFMDGLTMGGGVGISLHGAYPIATENFSFAMPETGIGLFPDIGASFLLSRCQGVLGIYLALTGARLDAFSALEAGLIKYILPSEALERLKKALASIKDNSYANLGALIQSLAMKEPPNGFNAGVLAKINHHFSHSNLTAVFSSLKESNDPWAKETLANLEQKSPLSLRLTWEQMQRAKHLSLSQCLCMDYTLMSHFMRDKDFYEGVRALLIDKDKKPLWEMASIDAVPEAKIDEYFSLC